jgi:hypothetical protein
MLLSRFAAAAKERADPIKKSDRRAINSLSFFRPLLLQPPYDFIQAEDRDSPGFVIWDQVVLDPRVDRSHFDAQHFGKLFDSQKNWEFLCRD